MTMTTQNFMKPLAKRDVPDGDGSMSSVAGGETLKGGDVCDTAVGTDESVNTGGDTQSPASLPGVDATKTYLDSGNPGKPGTQSPVTGWLNSGKVVATFDGTTPSTQVK